MSSTLSFAPATATRTWTAVLIDLDGTLIDSAPGSAALFPGMQHLVRELFDAAIPLALVSSGSRDRAAELLASLELDSYFDVIVGADPSAALSEAELVASALAQLGVAEHSASVVFVADRGADLSAASANGVPTVLVEWGYGGPDEAEGAHAVVHSVDQLRSLLLG